MPRVRRRKPKPEERNEAADAMAALVSGPKRSSTGLAKQVREVKLMMENEGQPGASVWAKAKASHLIALYYILHEMVYGVPPDLKGDELKQSKLASGQFLKSKCKGDFEMAVGYMRWIWKRERSREVWRRDNHIDGKVLGWRLIIRHPAMFTEYKVSIERRKHG